jgi:phosphatidylglycerophosphate synthase
MAKKETDHERVNDILLGPLERPALQWLSARMPDWVTPDVLTGIGIAGSLLIFASYWLANIDPLFLWLANIGFVVNWFGDSLDGTVARYRKIERPKYGFFVDHTVDAFSQLLIVLGLGMSPYVRFDIALLALVGYLMMSVLVYVRTYVDGVFRISYGKLGPTEIRVILILITTSFFFVKAETVNLPFADLTIYDLAIGFLAALLLLVFLVSTARQARELAKLDE